MLSTAEGCIKVHAYLSTDPVGPDSMSIQMWDNGKEVCKESQGKQLSSNTDVWRIQCGKYWAEVTQNGRAGKVGNSGKLATFLRFPWQGADSRPLRISRWLSGRTPSEKLEDNQSVLRGGRKWLPPSLWEL